MGNKHWVTGRVKTSRYGGRYVDTYPNTGGEKFQDGTAFEFSEPTFADEIRSMDCGTATAELNVTEQPDPYADANGQTKDIVGGDQQVTTLVTTGSTTVTLYKGDYFSVEAFCVLPSTGSNPNLHMDVTKNGTLVFDDDTPAVPGASMVFGEPVENNGDTYVINIVATADAPEDPVACGIDSSYAGGEAFPTDTVITLGSGLGNVVLNFDAVSVPDKFEVYFDGVKVIDTGYRGDTIYQDMLDAALAAMSPPLPPEPIVGTGSGTANFNKTTTSTTALVRVYAPLSGTAWSFRLGCPV